ncbi:MAG TPA: hypothetical protein ENJ00_08130 [Phycisphaerales bacterium]|nr:hypothetical protein [Phycisphaerales bacterium]
MELIPMQRVQPNMTRYLHTAFLLVLTALCIAQAHAQVEHDAFGGLFDELSLHEALDESIARSRALVLYVDPEDSRYRDSALASAESNRLLRFWMRQHAVIIRLGPEHARLAGQIRSEAGRICNRAEMRDPRTQEILAGGKADPMEPVYGLFINGRLFSAIGKCRLVTIVAQPNIHLGYTPALDTRQSWAVFGLDFELDRARAKDPVWSTLHGLRNPPIPREDIARFAGVEDDNANIFDITASEYPGDVLATLRTARLETETGDAIQAAGTYTWIWEKAAAHDPAFGPAVRTLVLSDIARAVQRFDNVSQRFERMQAELGSHLGTESLDDFAEWVRLSMVLGDQVSIIKELDYRLNEPSFGATVPRDVRRALYAIADGHADILEAVSRPASAATKIEKLYQRADAEPSETIRPVLRRLALDSAVAYHAKLLEGGYDDQARSIADIVRRFDGPAGLRALVAGALVVDQPRSWHADLLDQPGSAATRKMKDRLESELRSRAMPDPTPPAPEDEIDLFLIDHAE